eukprot:4625794-Amphidinium_carterae.1
MEGESRLHPHLLQVRQSRAVRLPLQTMSQDRANHQDATTSEDQNRIQPRTRYNQRRRQKRWSGPDDDGNDDDDDKKKKKDTNHDLSSSSSSSDNKKKKKDNTKKELRELREEIMRLRREREPVREEPPSTPKTKKNLKEAWETSSWRNPLQHLNEHALVERDVSREFTS